LIGGQDTTSREGEQYSDECSQESTHRSTPYPPKLIAGR
jgi:hypothetical protein